MAKTLEFTQQSDGKYASTFMAGGGLSLLQVMRQREGLINILAGADEGHLTYLRSAGLMKDVLCELNLPEGTVVRVVSNTPVTYGALIGAGESPEPQPEPEPEPAPGPAMLHLEARQAGSTVSLVSMLDTAPELEYSTDGKNWQTWQYTTETATMNEGQYNEYTATVHTFDVITLSETGDKIFLRGNNAALGEYDSEHYAYKASTFVMTGEIAAGGNVMSLLDEEMETDTVPDYGLYQLFKDCTALTCTPSLGTIGEIGEYGLCQLCDGCTSLVTASALETLTKINEGSCASIFRGCTSLTQAADMPLLELVGPSGLAQAYSGDTALVSPPEVGNFDFFGTSGSECSATFMDCTSLEEPMNLSGITRLGNWGSLNDMYNGCTSLRRASDMPLLTNQNVANADIGFYATYRNCTFPMSDDGLNFNFECGLTFPVTVGSYYSSTYRAPADMAAEMHAGALGPDGIAMTDLGFTFAHIKVSGLGAMGVRLNDEPWLNKTDFSRDVSCLRGGQVSVKVEVEAREGYAFGGWQIYANDGWTDLTAENPAYLTCNEGQTTWVRAKTVAVAPGVLRFEAKEAGSTVSLVSTLATAPELEYSTDGENWQTWGHTTDGGVHTFATITLQDIGDRVWLRGTNTAMATGLANFSSFALTGVLEASGSPMSLLDGTGAGSQVPAYGLAKLFMPAGYDLADPSTWDNALTVAPNLRAITQVGDYGCYQMFKGCNGLSDPADMYLLSSIGAHGCEEMYFGCRSILLNIYYGHLGMADMPNIATLGEDACYMMYAATTMTPYGYMATPKFCELPVTTSGGNPRTLETLDDVKDWMGNNAGSWDNPCAYIVDSPDGGIEYAGQSGSDATGYLRGSINVEAVANQGSVFSKWQIMGPNESQWRDLSQNNPLTEYSYKGYHLIRAVFEPAL